MPSIKSNIGFTGVTLNRVAVTGTYSVHFADYIIEASATGGSFNITLPDSTGLASKLYVFKRTDVTANTVTINTTSSQTIDGLLTYNLTSAVTLYSDGTNWQTVSGGTSGFSGMSGFSGKSGFSGSSGFSGFSGASAPSKNITFACPTSSSTTNNVADMGSWAITFGDHNLRISVTVDASGFSVTKQFELTIKYNQTNNTWFQCIPTQDSGGYWDSSSYQDFAVDVRVATTTATFRLRRTVGSTAGNAYCLFENLGSTSDVYTAGTGSVTSSSVPTDAQNFDSRGAQVGLNNTTGMTNARFINGFASNVSSGNSTIYTAPTGKRALVMGRGVYNIGSSTGSTSFYFQLLRSSTFYRLTSATSIAQSGYTGFEADPNIVLEPGDAIVINSSQSGLNCWVSLTEYDSNIPIKTSILLSLSSGDNIVYTCPQDKTARLLDQWMGGVQLSPLNYCAGSSAGGATAKWHIVYNTASPTSSNSNQITPPMAVSANSKPTNSTSIVSTGGPPPTTSATFATPIGPIALQGKVTVAPSSPTHTTGGDAVILNLSSGGANFGVAWINVEEIGDSNQIGI